METVELRLSLNYRRPLSRSELQEIKDQLYEFVESETDGGVLCPKENEVTDFEIEVEHTPDDDT